MSFLVGILFFFVFLLPGFSFSAPIYLKVNLRFYPKYNLLKGYLSTKLNSQEEYNFTISDLKIKEIKTTANISFKNNGRLFKVSPIEERSSLYVSFEKIVNPWILPMVIVNPPFPYPNKPFVYEINLKVYRTFKNLEILVPSEETKIVKTKRYILYTFRIRKPILKPWIIISPSKLVKKVFSYKQFKLCFFYSLEEEPFLHENLKSFFEEISPLLHYLENVGGDFYPLQEIFVGISENFSNTKDLSSILLINPITLKDPENFLHLLAKKKLEETIFLKEKDIENSLITYLIDYKLSKDKRFFRKLQASFPKKQTKAFFYLLFLSQKIGEENFIKLFNSFCQRNVLTFKTWSDFLDFIEKKQPELKNSLISYAEFQKLNLKGRINSIRKEEEHYTVDLTLKTGNFSFSSVSIPIKVLSENGSESLALVLKSNSQDFQISLNSKPRAIFIDPEYMLWRNLSFNEIPFYIKEIFDNNGTIIMKKEDLWIYRDLVHWLKRSGYKISFSWIDPLKTSDISQNLIYLDEPPISWEFSKPSQGFYLKVLPNPKNPEYVIAYLYASSKSELQSEMAIFKDFLFYSEVRAQSGEVVFKKRYQTSEGIPLLMPSENQCANATYSLRKFSIDLIGSQVILIGLTNGEGLCINFYRNLLKDIYDFNRNLILALDLPPFFQKTLEDYFTDKISEEQVKDELKNLGSLELMDIINWAKENKIKVFAIGTERTIFSKVLSSGIESLSPKELLKIPEIDLFNPSYREYLSYIFNSSDELKQFNFEYFYEAQILKLENLAENIKKLLKNFRHYQVVLFTRKDLIDKFWKLPFYLKIRKIFYFKSLFFDTETQTLVERDFSKGLKAPLKY